MSLTESATFNDTSSYYVSKTGTSTAGVLSLNGQSGVLNLASSDNSITIAGSPATVQLTTTGNALAPSTLTASGAVSGSTVSASGAVSGASVVASGAVSGATVSASGAVSGGSIISTGAIGGLSLALTNSMTSQFNNSAVVVQAGNADGPVLPLTALNTFLANRDASRSCLIMLNVSGGTPFVNGNPFCQAIIAVPPRNGATGDVGAKVYGAEDGLDLTIQPSGPQNARVMTINVQNLSGATQDYTYSYTVFGA